MQVVNLKRTDKGMYTVFSADFLIYNYPFRKRDKINYFLNKIGFQIINNKKAASRKLHIKRTIWFSIPKRFCIGISPDNAFFILAYPIALFLKEELEFDGWVSKKLYANIKKISVFYGLNNTDVEIKVNGLIRHRPTKRGVGQFFTLGLDSFYTLLFNKECQNAKKRYFIFIDGYDVPLEKKELCNLIRMRVNKVATITNRIPIYVATNLRDATNMFIAWKFYHGAALASVCLLLTSVIGKMYFNASDGYNIVFPWGTKTDLDPLWSTEDIEFDSFGENEDRMTKIKAIKKTKLFPLFLHYLRVCYKDITSTKKFLNCSICEKCIRTQLAFIANDIPVETLPFIPFQEKWLENIHITSNNFTIWKNLYRYLLKIKLYDKKELLLAKLRWLFKREKITIN